MNRQITLYQTYLLYQMTDRYLQEKIEIKNGKN